MQSLLPLPSCFHASRRKKRNSLLIALFAILALNGCVVSAKKTKPHRPMLESLSVTSDGGICMDRNDATNLLLYIDAMERN